MVFDEGKMITVLEAASMFGYSYQNNLPERLRVDLLERFSAGKDLIDKGKIELFLENHRRVVDLRDEVLAICSIKPHSFESKYKSSFETIGIEPIMISNRVNYIFLTLYDYEKSLEYYKKLYHHPESNLYTLQEIGEILGLSVTRNSLFGIVVKHGIEPYIKIGNKTYYHHNQVTKLKELQTTEINEMTNYISVEEFSNKHGYRKSNVLAWLNRKNTKTIVSPTIIKNKYPGERKYFLREIGDEYHKQYTIQKEVTKQLASPEIDNEPFKIYEKIIEIYGFHFSSFGPITNEYWHKFAKKKLQQSSVKDIHLLVHNYALMAGHLMNLVNSSRKELFQFTANELNFSLLNDKVAYTYRVQYYSFLNNIHKGLQENGGKSFININNLRSPKSERKKNHKPQKKEIYDSDVFISLTKYCMKIELHKDKAISNLTQATNKHHKSYASMWLYVMIQLTNVWRHSDVIEFPRIRGLFADKDLKWLSENSLSKQDAEIICAYFESKIYVHHKNQQSRHFIISDDLMIPFATAALICEFSQRESNEIRDNLMEFNNRRKYPNQQIHEEFFHLFPYENFVFENRKANWTVMTLATQVVSTMTGRNPLEISKYLRNHSDSEIANIYVQLPQEHVDFIAEHLFNLGSFGYIYDSMAKILFDDSSNNSKKHRNAIAVKNVFHDVEVVEGIAKNLNRLYKEQDFVINTLATISRTELEEQSTNIKFGLLPAKKEGYQCLVGGISNCPFPTKDCLKCEFNIPTRFAIHSLAYDIEKAINDIEENYERTKLSAERVRMANNLFMTLSLLNTAIEHLGRDVVNQLLPGGIDNINSRMKSIPSTKSFVTDGIQNILIEKGISTL